MKLTMSLSDVVRELRRYGMHTSPTRVGDAIANGHYTFGRLVSTGPTGRREFEIFQTDFDRWLQERIPQQSCP